MFRYFFFLFPPTLVRTLLAILLFLSSLAATAQAPAWQSAQAVGIARSAVAGNTGNNSVLTATAVDASGNVYLAGYFTNTVVLGGTTLTSLGGSDVFVAKFNPTSNQFIWAQQAGGILEDFATALAVSGTSVYMAGHFGSPTASFGITTLNNVGGYDIFVSKLTDAGSTGSFAWAQRAGGTDYDYAYALTLSGTSVYVAGYFRGSTASFGLTTLANAGTNSSTDIFVTKLTDAGSTGSFVWAQRAGGTNSEQAYALAVSGTSVYVAGSFSSPVAGFGATTLVSAGYSDVFVTKLTDAGSTGSFAWAQRAGGTDYDYAYALTLSGTSVYVAGHFYSRTVGFGSDILTNTNLGYSDVFVTKLTDAGSTGSFVWAQRAGGTNSEQAYALAVSGTSVYVAGSFSSPVAGFGATTLVSAGYSDVFVTKLTDAGSTGSFAWAQRAGGAGFNAATSLALSGTRVHVAGNFLGSTANFGPIIITNPFPNPNPGSGIGFLASLTDATLTATTATAGPREPAALFPNPARHAATLRLPTGTTPAPLVLTDALGRAVRRYPAPAGAGATLDLQGLPAGLYLLRGTGPAQRLVIE